MDTNEAIIKRVNELCKNLNMSLTALSLASNLTPSTVFEFMKGETKIPKVITIKKICAGAGITLEEFFSPKYFNDFDDCYR